MAVERRLVRVVVTPRMHGIHHSIFREEASSNWSSGLTLWDRLHGTRRLDLPQEDVVVGVPAWRDRQELSLPSILELPFHAQPPSWCWKGGGRPVRTVAVSPRDAEVFPDPAGMPGQ